MTATRYLVTGGCGFLGSNLAAEVIARGGELCILDNLSRLGSAENLAWLRSLGSLEFVRADVREERAVRDTVAAFEPDAVFHVAGQVAMTTSIEDPRLDFETNALGTFNVLEAVRLHCRDAAVVYSSTNKVYGDLDYIRYEETAERYVAPDHPHGFDERLPLDFRTPYGCSKGAADQYMRDYARVYGLATVVFRHSSMYGGRQFPTYDQGWIGWFCDQALRIQQGTATLPLTISGNGKQVRDVLHAEDMKRLYFAALARGPAVAGEVFNIGGGMANSLSLRELFRLLEELLEIWVEYRQLPPRASDQKIFVADISKARDRLGWTPQVAMRDGIGDLLSWLRARGAGP